MKLINVAEFVPELHANAKFTDVSVEEAAHWWAERIKKRRHPGRPESVWTTARAIISTMVFFGIIIDETAE
jgi:hypothetical protein